MRPEIKRFLRKCIAKWKLEAYYIPEKDVYMLLRAGKAVNGFTTQAFFQIPPSLRFKEVEGILKLGLNHNLGERAMRDNVYQKRKLGIPIK
jgi:hypothetical protein